MNHCVNISQPCDVSTICCSNGYCYENTYCIRDNTIAICFASFFVFSSFIALVLYRRRPEQTL